MLNTQGYGFSYASTLNPDLLSSLSKPRLNTDNNGRLFINPYPTVLYNFQISDDFLKNGILEFELIYDVGNAWKNTANNNQFTFVPQTLDFTTDSNDLEAFSISMIILDEDDSNEKVYDDKKLLYKINKLMLKNNEGYK